MKVNRPVTIRQEQQHERALCTAILALRSVEECRCFFRDLCTPAELQAMADRWAVVELLERGLPYREIHKQTGVSVTTISRVADIEVIGVDTLSASNNLMAVATSSGYGAISTDHLPAAGWSGAGACAARTGSLAGRGQRPGPAPRVDRRLRQPVEREAQRRKPRASVDDKSFEYFLIAA